MKRGLLLVMLAIGLSACGSSPNEVEPRPIETPKPVVTSVPQSGAAQECARDPAGQIACLIENFALKSCDGAVVLGSMFKTNENDDTFNFRTAYGLDNACRAELEAAVASRSFREEGKGEFVARRNSGYREGVIFGLQTSPDGSVVEWERIQE